LHFGSAMDSPVLPHNPQSTANEGDSRYAQPPQVGGRLLTPATLHSQVGCRVGSLLVPFPPATPIPPCVKCEMFLRRQEAQKSVSKKQQRAEEEHGHRHPILCRIHRCRRCIGDKSRLHSSSSPSQGCRTPSRDYKCNAAVQQAIEDGYEPPLPHIARITGQTIVNTTVAVVVSDVPKFTAKPIRRCRTNRPPPQPFPLR
jgi:hypothetical protein